MFISMYSLDQFDLCRLLLLYRRDDRFQFNGVNVGGCGRWRYWDQVEGLQIQRVHQPRLCCSAHLADVGEGSVLGLLVNIVDGLSVLLLVVDEAAAVGSCPGTLVTFVGMFACVPSAVVDQIV